MKKKDHQKKKKKGKRQRKKTETNQQTTIKDNPEIRRTNKAFCMTERNNVDCRLQKARPLMQLY